MEPKETKKEVAPRSPKSAPAKKAVMGIEAKSAPSVPPVKPRNKYAPKAKIRPTFGNVTTTTH